jgi:hypothetical protein
MSQELNGLNGRPKARIVTAPAGPAPGLVPERQTLGRLAPGCLAPAGSRLPQLARGLAVPARRADQACADRGRLAPRRELAAGVRGEPHRGRCRRAGRPLVELCGRCHEHHHERGHEQCQPGRSGEPGRLGALLADYGRHPDYLASASPSPCTPYGRNRAVMNTTVQPPGSHRGVIPRVAVGPGPPARLRPRGRATACGAVALRGACMGRGGAAAGCGGAAAGAARNARRGSCNCG